MKPTLTVLTIAFLWLTASAGIVDEKSNFTQLMAEDSVGIVTVAAYPEAVRGYVFEACTQPQVIVNVADLQSKSNAKFRSILSSYSKEEQRKIWNLVRYNGLIGNLLSVRKNSQNEIDSVLQSYPEEVRADARSYVLNNRDLLKQVHDINKEFDLSLANMIREYSTTVQNAYLKLLSTPELISLLNSHMHLTVRLGDIYKKSPTFLKSEFDALSLQLAQQKAADLEEWKQTMAANPDAENELKQSAQNYAEDNEYAPSEYTETDPEVVTSYVFIPYPYWSGYPWWYDYECWYPYPYWYHWGFYHWHGHVHWFGLPSWHYMHWHFWHHQHFYHYPHITNVYINYYNGPRGGHIRNSATVHQWFSENKQDLPDDFIINQNNRINVIKDYGRFEMDYQKENKSAAGIIDRNDFLRQNADKYPNLKPVVKKMPEQNYDIFNERWIEEKPNKKQQPAKTSEPKKEEKKYFPEGKNRMENKAPIKEPVKIDPGGTNKPEPKGRVQKPDVKPQKQVNPRGQQQQKINPQRSIPPPTQKQPARQNRIPVNRGGK